MKMKTQFGIFVTAFNLVVASVHADSWVVQQSRTTEDLTDVHFIDAKTGFVSGSIGTILKTDNGGVTWRAATSPQNFSFLSVFALDANDVFLARNSLQRTQDGGSTWDEIGLSGGATSIFDIKFSSPDRGFLVQGGWVHRTTDGGETWSAVYQNPDGLFLSEIDAPSDEA